MSSRCWVVPSTGRRSATTALATVGGDSTHTRFPDPPETFPGDRGLEMEHEPQYMSAEKVREIYAIEEERWATLIERLAQND